MKLTVEEVLQDVAWTQEDIQDLHQIVDAMRRFLGNNRGEDRRHLRIELMRLESLESEAIRLNKLIDARLRELTGTNVAASSASDSGGQGDQGSSPKEPSDLP